MSKTIALVSYRGGCGKSTTAQALASILTKEHGKRVLLVDCDPQGNDSVTLNADLENYPTLFEVMFEDAPVHEALQHTEYGDLIASDQAMYQANNLLEHDPAKGDRLKKALEPVSGDYDFILLDAAPGLSNMTGAVLMASDEVLIPIKAEPYSLQGLPYLLQTMESLRQGSGSDLKISGIVLNDYDGRTRLGRDSKDFAQNFAEQTGVRLYKQAIRHSVRIPESQLYQQALIDFDPHCGAAWDQKSFVKEFLESAED